MSVVRGYLAEIRVLPMSLLLLTTLLGGLLSGHAINWYVMGLVLVNAFCYIYVAHLWDTYNDYYRKGEYGDRKFHVAKVRDDEYLPRWGFGPEIPNAPILPKEYYLVAVIVFSAIGLGVMIYISTIVGFMYSLIAIVGLVLALTYSAGLDRIPALGDTVWEVGVLMAMWCGYYSQKHVIDSFIVSMSIPLFISLISVKALDSLPDTLVDHKNNKITLTVFLYRMGLSLKTIRHICYIPMYIAFTILYLLLPPNMKLGALAVIAVTFVEQIAFRNDVRGSISIVVAGITILVFLVLSILVISGHLVLPSI